MYLDEKERAKRAVKAAKRAACIAVDASVAVAMAKAEALRALRNAVGCSRLSADIDAGRRSADRLDAE
jgi:hypothetical protein